MSAVDTNADGRAELFIDGIPAGGGGRAARVFSLQGSALTACPGTYATLPMNRASWFGELDGDGRMDAVSSTTTSFGASTYFVHLTR